MQRSVFLSTFLFAAVLSPITLHGNDCAPPADARLAILELRVGSFHGENTIEGFDPNVFSYDARFPEEESVGVLWVRAQHPSASIEVEYNGAPVKLVGQSVAKLDVPLGQSELTIQVATRGLMPDSQTYVVRIQRVPVFACTEQGIRDAIRRGGGPIYFDCNGSTTVVTEAEIEINNDVILDGEGNLIVDAGSTVPLSAGEVTPKVNGAHRVFSIPEGFTAELIGFTVTGGSTTGDGGGILNAGVFTLADSTVTANSADRGGGVGNLDTGLLTIVSSNISDNTADLAGGVGTLGIAEIVNTRVSGNTALSGGGGLGVATGGNLTVTGSVVEGNTTPGLAGGVGVEELGTLTMYNTTVANNEADSQSGGMENGGWASLNDCTVVGNRATNFNGGIGNSGVLTLNNTTVAANSVIGDGGGIGSIGSVTLRNSIVSENTATGFSGGIGNNGEVTLIDSTVSDNSCGLDGGGIASFSGTTTLTNTTVSGNEAGGAGGGALNEGALTLTASTVSGNSAVNEGGGVFSAGTLTLIGSTVSGNVADIGGGIRNLGALNVTGSLLAENTAASFGGGIHSAGFSEVIDSTVSNNTAMIASGGVSNRAGATMTLTRTIVQGNNAATVAGGIANRGTIALNVSVVSGNQAGSIGGGVVNQDVGTVSMIDTTVSSNTAETQGGGIFNEGALTLTNAVVSSNTSGADGGGIFNSGTLIIMRSTIAENTGATSGGGIENYSGSIEIDSSTISGNTATAGGGGAIENPFPEGTLSLTNTTVSGNSSIGRGAIENAGSAVVIASTLSLNVADGTVLWDGACLLAPECPPGTITIRNTILDGPCIGASDVVSLGGNIESPGNTCWLIPGIDLINVPAAQLGLAPLANNGGPTETQALAPFSVALDRISEPECVDGNGLPLLTDQRGVPRPQGPACDSGAFELGDGPPPMGACINDADRMTYESLEYIDSDGMLFTCIDAAAAIGSNCVFGSAQSEPPLEGCAAEAAAVLACFPNCPEDVIETLGICVAFCAAEATGLSSSCARCYGEATACGVAWCASLCVVDIDFPPCVSCRIENGCIPGFDTCSGLPGDIDCSGTGGTGGSGGTGGTGGTGGSGGIPGVEYTQNFESLDQMSPTALGDDGWLIFGQVFDGSGTLKFDYGPFPAPNATVDPSTTFFSAIVTAEGGLDQGAQQLSIYNDYNCCDPPNQGHFNGTDRVTSLVFQEPFSAAVPISAGEVGKTVTFSFDARRGNINDPAVPGCAGTPNPPCDSTANAYINTLDPNAGFALTNNITEDTTNLPETWARYSIELEIDPSLVGQILQFGFANTASSFEPSGVFYDNVLVVFKAP